MKLNRIAAYLFLIFILFPISGITEEKTEDSRGISGTKPPGTENSKNETRLALVIGNSSYSGGPLKNPVNDADDLAAALKKLDFQVIHLKNAKLREMKEGIRQFGQKLRRFDVGLFFYAGHGVQVNERNYLIPVDANIEKEADVEYEAVDAGRVMAEITEAGNRLNIIILDACRNNPFARSFRSRSEGLASMDAPSETLIAYATAPGKVAADGEGRNSPFTKHLLRYIETPDLTLDKVLKNVRKDVIKETGNKQIPWESHSLTEDFYFIRSVAKLQPPPEPLVAKPPVEPTVKPTPAPTPPPVEKTTLTVESNISDAKVSVNGRPFGTTPLRDKEISPGTVKIRLEKNGYQPNETEVILQKGRNPINMPLIAMKTEPLPLPKPKITAPEPAKKPWKDPVTGMEFIWVSPGCFQMGSTNADTEKSSDETPAHEVCLSGYWMGKQEVTQGQWKKVMSANPSSFQNCGENCPVENISWLEIQDFIRKLSEKSRGKFQFRLPTEAEWEYACRAGNNSRRYWGDDPKSACLYANVADYSAKDQYWDWAVHDCDDGFIHTAPAGRFKPNAWGFSDMLGNVWEWCQDEKNNEAYRLTSRDNPLYADNSRAVTARSSVIHVIRGGSWRELPSVVRSARRNGISAGERKNDVGFRLIRLP